MIYQRKNEPCPTVDQWSQALAADFEDSVQSEELALHIEECKCCRETLVYLASDATFAEELQLRLGCSQPPVPKLSTRILALSGGRTNHCTETWEVELGQLREWLDPPSHPELIGVLGRYELHELVGRGGMGLVFRARDLELQRVVAVKTLSLHLATLGTARERFAREGRAIASLSHPHVVQVYDVVTDHAVPALVMQYVPGETLEDRIQSQGRIGVEDAMRIAAQLLSALAAAHDSGLVHRDIKPGNVLLEADGCRALLSDFGLVRTLDDASLTHSGFLAGTPHYMSPEQARGESVDARSDLFSLGALVYHMLAGHPPFRAPEPMAVLHRLCSQVHRPLQQIDPHIPVELSRWVDRLLAKDPNRRFASAMVARLELLALQHAPRRLLHSAMGTITRRHLWTASAALVCLAAAIGVTKYFSKERPAGVASAVDRPPAMTLTAPADPEPSSSVSTSAEPSSEPSAASAVHLAALASADEEQLRQWASLSDLDARVQQLFRDVDQARSDLNRSYETVEWRIEWPDVAPTIEQLSEELKQLSNAGQMMAQ